MSSTGASAAACIVGLAAVWASTPWRFCRVRRERPTAVGSSVPAWDTGRCRSRGSAPRPAHGRRLASAAGRAGRELRRLAGRPPDPMADIRVGSAVAAGLAATLVHSILGVVVAGVVWSLPAWRAAVTTRRRREAVVDGLPDVVDLLALAVGAGLNVRLALEAVCRAGDGPVVAVLRDVLARLGAGDRLADALDGLDALGEEARPLRDALVASERYGVPIATGLERVAYEVRLQRRRMAEADARRAPVRALFPLVLCFLPAFGLLTVVPLVAGSLVSLAP